VASIENLPLNLNLKAGAAKRVENILDKQPEIEAFSPRIKFGGMFSTFIETTNIRLNGVYPDKEFKTIPLLQSRIISGEKDIKPGEILIPKLLAKGMKVNVGDTIAAIGTQPGKILSMFLMEGLCLGFVGAIVGNIAGYAIITAINLSKFTFDFGQQKGLLLQSTVNPADLLFISATVIIVSVIASIQPAFKASLMEPIKALRHV